MLLNNKRFFLILLFIISLCFICHRSSANWPTQWSDDQYWWVDGNSIITYYGVDISDDLNTDSLHVVGDATFDGNIDFEGTLYQNGVEFVSSYWTEAESGDISTDVNVNIDGTLDVSDDLDVNNGNFKVDISNDVISSTSDASFDKSLRVGNDATFDSNVNIDGNLGGVDNLHLSEDLTMISGQNLKISGDTVSGNALTIKQAATNNEITGTANYVSIETEISQSADTSYAILNLDVTESVNAGLTAMDYLIKGTVDSSGKFCVDRTGKTGIGNTDPNCILDIYDAAPIIALHNTTETNTETGRDTKFDFIGERADGTHDVLVRQIAGHDGTSANGKGEWTLQTSNSDGDLQNAITVDSDGDFYLAASSPTTINDHDGPKIQIEGLEPYIALQSTDSNANYWTIVSNGASTNQVLSFRSDNTSKLRIYPSGNVIVSSGSFAVNTTDPSTDLHVVGGMQVTEDATFDGNIDSASYTISGSPLDMDDLVDGSVNAAITLSQEASYDLAVTHSEDNTQAHTDYLLNNASDSMDGTLTTTGIICNGQMDVSDDIDASGDVNIATGKSFKIGSTIWSSSDEIDGTKIKDADYGDVSVDTNGTWSVDTDELSDGSTNAIVTLVQEASYDLAVTHSEDNSQAHTDYVTNNANDTMDGSYIITGNLDVSDDIDASNDINAIGNISSSNFLPNSADEASVGSSELEISDIYLADGGIIYGQNDQSATITSSADGFTFNKFPMTPDATPDANLEVANKIYVDNAIVAAGVGAGDIISVGDVASGAAFNGTQGTILTFNNDTTGDATINYDGTYFNFSSDISSDLIGNASTATALETARTISGVSFDGTANITIDMDDMADGSTNAAITLAQEASYDATVLTVQNNAIITTAQEASYDAVVLSVENLDMDDLADGSTNAAITLAQEASYDVAVDRSEEIIFPIVIRNPLSLGASDVSADMIVFTNHTSDNLTITKIYSMSDRDDVDYVLKEWSYHDNSDDVNTIYSCTIATDGIGRYYDATEDLSHVIEPQHHIVFDNDEADDPQGIELTIIMER